MTVETETRNAELADLVALLKTQHAQKLDVVAPASQFTARDGLIVVKGAGQVVSEEGVTAVDGVYRPTAVFDEGIADKLRIPVGYVRRLRQERPDLYDANVNGWLHGRNPRWRLVTDADLAELRSAPDPAEVPGFSADGTRRMEREAIPGDGRKFLLRLFTDPDTVGGVGVARALLSDQYKVVDNVDVIQAIGRGMAAAGSQAQIEACDLTDRRMYVRFVDPTLKVAVPTLLEHYRDPFHGAAIDLRRNDLAFWRDVAHREGMGFDAGAEPVLWAGWVASNSEVGGGALSLTPRGTVQICRNGLTITADMARAVHLGARLDEGVIEWSIETREKNLALITSMVADSVRKFSSLDYWQTVADRIEEKAGAPVAKPEETIKRIGKTLLWDEPTTESILAMFYRGGDETAGGVMQAVTAHAQTVSNADRAFELEGQALRVLEFAAL